MLEAILLLGILILSSFFTQSPVLATICFVTACALGIPFFRLIVAKAPPFIPTRKGDVRTMIRLAGIRKGEHACDLGCGDGRIVRAAAEQGAIATGYELSLPTYLLAKLLSMGRRNVSIRFGNFWKQDFSDTDVIFCFLLKESMADFQKTIWPALKPGSRVVSYMFRLPDVAKKNDDRTVHLYVK